MNNNFDPTVFDSMQTGEPLAVYQKTILGKVHVIVLDPFSREPQGYLLTGQPGEESSQYRVWSTPEDVFFKRQNRRHFERGTVIKVNVSQEEPVKATTIEQSSDEDLRKLVNGKFLVLQNTLRKTESEALVFRILSIAEEEEKSEKLISAIRTRLAELQSVKFDTQDSE